MFEETAVLTDVFTVTAMDPEASLLTYTCIPDPDDGNFDGSCDLSESLECASFINLCRVKIAKILHCIVSYAP